MNKQNRITYMLLLIIAFNSINTAYANTTNITVLNDTYVSIFDPTVNYGNNLWTYIYCDTGCSLEKYGLFRYNTSAIPLEATIYSATHYYYTYGGNNYPKTYSIYNITDRTWNENEVTWNNKPTATFIQNVTDISGCNSDCYNYFDVTPLFIDQFNKGINVEIEIRGKNDGNSTDLEIQTIENTHPSYISINWSLPEMKVIYFGNNISNNENLNIYIEQSQTIRFDIITNFNIDNTITSCGSGIPVEESIINTTDYYMDCKYNTVGTTYANISITNTTTSTSDYKNWTVNVNEVSTPTPNILRGVSYINATSNPFVWQNNLGHDTILIISDGKVSDISFSIDNITYYASDTNSGYFYVMNGEYVSVSYKLGNIPTIIRMG